MVTQAENLCQTYFRNEAAKAADPFFRYLQPPFILWLSLTRFDPRFSQELYVANVVCPSCHQRSCNNPFCKGE